LKIEPQITVLNTCTGWAKKLYVFNSPNGCNRKNEMDFTKMLTEFMRIMIQTKFL